VSLGEQLGYSGAGLIPQLSNRGHLASKHLGGGTQVAQWALKGQW
jgi:hypothetical protein